jgi:hypothetical protein
VENLTPAHLLGPASIGLGFHRPTGIVSIGIINFKLEGTILDGDPAALVRGHMEAFFPGSAISYAEHILDINLEDPTLTAKHQRAVDRIVMQMER